MAYAPTPLNAKRAPKYLDLASVDATPLTLSAAAPRQMNLTHEEQAMRLLGAVHEGTHFVAMGEEGDPVISVVVSTRPLSRKAYKGGEVCGLNNTQYENEWFTTLVGSTVEFMLLNTPGQEHLSPAFFHDFKQAETECRAWYTYEVEMGRLDGPAEKHVAAALGGDLGTRALSYVRKRWQLIELCATVFLIYGDRDGNVGREVIAALRAAVAKRMTSPWPTQHRSISPAALRDSLPPDVLGIWRKHSPHIDPEDWLDAA